MATDFVPPQRPEPLPITKTCVFKTVNEVPIHVDLYSPMSTAVDARNAKSPIMLYIHGGGWMGSNRDDYSRPLFQHFLDSGFVIANMDYRLVPESSIYQQFEDVRDMEKWLQDELPHELGEDLESALPQANDAQHARNIIVVGASAGAHLSLFVVS